MRKAFAVLLATVILCGLATSALANPNGTINPLGGVKSSWTRVSPW